MTDSRSDADQPVAWRALVEGTPVRTADGAAVGKIVDVLGAGTEDIFHGLVVKRTGGGEAMIPADRVTRMTSGSVEVDLTPTEAARLPAYRPEETFHLGLTGRLRKRESWIKDK